MAEENSKIENLLCEDLQIGTKHQLIFEFLNQ